MSDGPKADSPSRDRRDRAIPLLTRFARSWFPAALAMFGGCVIAIWFLFDVTSAEIPDLHDVPLELKLQYDRNRLFARRLFLAGVSGTAAGFVLLIAQLMSRLCLGRLGRRLGTPSSDAKGP